MTQPKYVRCDACYHRIRLEDYATASSVINNHKLIDCVVAAKHPEFKGRRKNKKVIEPFPIDMSMF